jgi:integrase
MATIALTDLSIRSLKCDARTDFWDARTPSFGIRVGRRSKVFIAKIANQRHTIGPYPELSLADARRKALALKSEDAPVVRSKITFDQAYEKFKTAHVATKKPRTQHDYTRVLDKYFLPSFGKTRLIKITYEAITKITDALSATPSEQAHALAVARMFFKWCARPPRRYAPSPLEDLQLIIGKSRKRTLSDAEMVKIWRAAEQQGYPHGTVVRLLLLTGQRRGEVAWLQRAWINEKDRTITLPDWLTKNTREHTFPYGDVTRQILETVPIFKSTDLLFPTRWADDRPLSGWSKYKSEMTDGVAGWTLHDLRRTFATRLAEMKVAPHVVERLLNHKLGSIANKTDGIVSAVAEVYNRAAYMSEMRNAISLWEAYLATRIAEVATHKPASTATAPVL